MVMSLESYRRRDGLISYSYKFVWHGRTYRGAIGPVSLRQAKLAELQAKVLAAEGKHPLPKRQQRRTQASSLAPVPTFLEFAPTFLASYAVDARPRSVRTYEDRLNLHLLPYFASLRLDQATTQVIDAYRTARRQEGAAPNTINGELATLSKVLRSAVEWGHISKADLGMVRWLRVEENPTRVLSDEEEARLLMAATPHLRPLMRFALQTGLRKQELLTLTWDDIDLVRKEVTVVGYVAKNRHRRVIPLNTEALDALQDARSRHGLVFGYHSIGAQMDRTAKKASLPGVNCHVFRRTFATRCLEAGINVRTLQRWLGHASLATTQKYVNPSGRYEREAIELLVKPSHRRSMPLG
jgi:integrase